MPSFSTTLTLLATLGTGLSLPATLAPRQTSFISVTLRASSSAGFLDGASIVAAGTNSPVFWAGAESRTFCSLPAPECAQYPNTTIVTVTQNNGVGTAKLASTVGGGQTVYVPTTGALSYLEPFDETGVPQDSYTSNFVVQEVGGVDLFEFTGGDSTGWVACPIEGVQQLPYEVFARVSSMGPLNANCVDLVIKAQGAVAPGAYGYENHQ